MNKINRRNFINNAVAASVVVSFPLAKAGAGNLSFPDTEVRPEDYFTKYNLNPGELSLFSTGLDKTSLCMRETASGWKASCENSQETYIPSWSVGGVGKTQVGAETDALNKLRSVMGQALIHAGTYGENHAHRPVERNQARFMVSEALKILRPVPERKPEFFELCGYLIGVDTSVPDALVWISRQEVSFYDKNTFNFYAEWGVAILDTKLVAAQRITKA